MLVREKLTHPGGLPLPGGPAIAINVMESIQSCLKIELHKKE